MRHDQALHCHLDGPAGAPVLVLIHGLCESLRAWDRVVPLLSDRYRILRVDLLGFGDSPLAHGGYEIEEQAAAVADAIARHEIESAALVGHSLGGSVAVAVAERDHESARSLVLVNAPPTKESRLLSRAERSLRTMVLGEAAWSLMRDRERRAGLASAFAPSYPVPDVFLEDLKRTTHAAFSGSSFALERYLEQRPLAQRVESLGLPTMVIFGMRDLRVDAAALAPLEQLANVRVERLADSGHSPMWEEPERTAALIAAA